MLTRFEGEGLRLTKSEVPGEDLTYLVSIPVADEASADEDPSQQPKQYQATFEFQLEAINPMEGVPVLTGTAAVQEINLSYDESGWDVVCPTAVRIESVESDDETNASQGAAWDPETRACC